jgi:hypothetical protein
MLSAVCVKKRMMTWQIKDMQVPQLVSLGMCWGLSTKSIGFQIIAMWWQHRSHRGWPIVF